MDNIFEYSNEQLIQLYKNSGCSLKQIERDFNLHKNRVSRLFKKRGIDYNKIKQETIVVPSKPIRYYKYCGKPLPLNSRRSKQFCSQSCATTYSNLQRGKNLATQKYCLNCGKPLKYAYGKFCNNTCMAEYKYKVKVQDWKDGKITGVVGKYETAGFIRKYLLDKHNNKCQICGWGEKNPVTGKVPLQIHHIDGNCLNNKEDNLQLLCPNCHSLTSTFGSLNKKSSRVFRKQKENI